MLSPIIARMSQVGIEKFDYLAFQIPLTFFIVSYLLFIIINIKEKKLVSDSANSQSLSTNKH